MSFFSSVRDVEDAGPELAALVAGPPVRAWGARRRLGRPAVAAAAAVALVVCIGGAAFWVPAGSGRGAGAGAAAAPAAPTGSRAGSGAGLRMAEDSAAIQLLDDVSERGGDSKPPSEGEQQEGDAKQRQEGGGDEKAALPAGRAPVEEGCFTIDDSEECCKHYDGRTWDAYFGSECVPSKPGTAFENGRTCQPKCWVDGVCRWRHPEVVYEWQNSTAFADVCPTTTSTATATSTTTVTTTTVTTTTVTTTTVTTTVTTTSTTTPVCWMEAVTFEPLNDNLTQPIVQVGSALECQALCQKEKHCMHFAFWKPAGHCYFQDIWARPQPSRVGFVSGPRWCGKSLDMSKWENIGDDTWVPEQFGCMQVGITFTSNILEAEVEIDKKLSGPQVTLACQAACAARADCANFTMDVEDRDCELVGAGAMTSPTASETVVGPPTC